MEKMDRGIGGLCVQEITFHHTTLSIHKIASMQHKAPFTQYNLLSNWLSNVCIHDTTIVKPVWQTAVSCIQPVVKPVVQPGLTTSCLFNTVVKPCLSNRLYNPVWQLVERTVCSFNTVVKPVVKPVWQPAVSCIRTFNRLSNGFDNRLDVCLHDTAGCQTSCTTGLTTGCIV